MLQGKKAYICSPLAAPNPEGVQHNMELAKYYLMQMKKGIRDLWGNIYAENYSTETAAVRVMVARM